jgi:predicted DNA-binding protein
MQPTTSLKLPPELKKRIATLAKREGKSMHGFLLETIERRANALESYDEFIASALAAEEEFRRTGKYYAMEDVHAYFRARAAGKKAKRPRLRTWRR